MNNLDQFINSIRHLREHCVFEGDDRDKRSKTVEQKHDARFLAGEAAAYKEAELRLRIALSRLERANGLDLLLPINLDEFNPTGTPKQ